MNHKRAINAVNVHYLNDFSLLKEYFLKKAEIKINYPFLSEKLILIAFFNKDNMYRFLKNITFV